MFRSFFQLAGSVLLLAAVTLASSHRSDRVAITVFVNNSARVSDSILGDSEAEASRILQAGGIEVSWVHCQEAGHICSRAPAVNQFVIHLIPIGSSPNDFVFGTAFVGENGTGKYCDVFVNRIKQTHDDVASVGELMGTVMAHELGHLLLGSRSHSTEGLMRPIWDHQCLKGIGMGRFLLTPQQESMIKKRFREATAGVQGNRLSEGN